MGIFLVLFALCQMAINCKQGVVFTPFFHYGMYSSKIALQKNTHVLEVYVNGNMLRGSDFNAVQWDKVMVPLYLFAATRANQTFYENDVKRLLQKVGISARDQHFIAACQYNAFESWYKQYLSGIVGQQVVTVNILSRAYLMNTQLQPTDRVNKLSEVCP